eukprot:356755-Chlamydomonas_euryale.AAC.2
MQQPSETGTVLATSAAQSGPGMNLSGPGTAVVTAAIGCAVTSAIGCVQLRASSKGISAGSPDVPHSPGVPHIRLVPHSPVRRTA